MKHIYFLLIACVIPCSVFTTAQAAHAGDSAKTWQVNRLLQPAQADLQRERQGHIMIYHGLTDKVVVSALDRNFDRIESMMFTGTVITDEASKPAVDPATGEVVTENDGC